MLKKVPNKGTTSGHIIYLPENYDTTKKWPVVLFFHGDGQKGDGSDAGLQNLYDFVDSIWYPFLAQLKKDRFIFIALQLPWNLVEWPIKYVDDAFAIAAQYSIDPARIYLSGVSRGGTAVWGYTTASPENGQKFAGILACCCVGVQGNFANIKSPVLAYHAKNDGTVAFANSDSVVNAINASNPPVKAQLKSTMGSMQLSGHEIWGLVFGNNEGWDWLLAQAKQGTEQPVTPTKQIAFTIELDDGKLFTYYMDRSYELK
jgi:predicted peptidase